MESVLVCRPACVGNARWPSLHLPAAAAAVFVVAGLALRLYLLSEKSLWLDEAFSLAISRQNPLETLRLVVQTDTHPPLYYLVLNLWLRGGATDGWVRLLSLLFSVASIPVIYRLAEVLFEDSRAGAVAAAILALSPFHIWYAQEARMYAMLTFLVLVSALFLVLGLRRGGIVAWLGYAMATSLALYTDNGAIWFVLATGLFFVVSIRRFQERILPWALSQGAIALIYAPWLPSLLIQTRRVTEDFWLPAPSFQAVLQTFLDFNSLNFPWMAPSVVYVVALFVFAYIVPERQGWQRGFLSLWLFAPPTISLLLSLRQPIFLSRNLIAASLGYYLLIAGTIARFRGNRARALLLAPLMAMSLGSLAHNAWAESKEDWRSAAAYVARHVQGRTGGLIVFVPSYAELPFRHYFQPYGIAVETQGYPEDEVLLHPEPRPVEDLDILFADRAYVWLVLRDVEAADPDGNVKGWLDSHGYVRTGDLTLEEIVVIRYVRWDSLKPRLVGAGEGSPSVPSKGGCRVALGPTHCEEPSPMKMLDGASANLSHTVQAGETLDSIARRYKTSVEALVEINDIANPSMIFVGQELVVP